MVRYRFGITWGWELWQNFHFVVNYPLIVNQVNYKQRETWSKIPQDSVYMTQGSYLKCEKPPCILQTTNRNTHPYTKGLMDSEFTDSIQVYSINSWSESEGAIYVVTILSYGTRATWGEANGSRAQWWSRMGCFLKCSNVQPFVTSPDL